MVGVHKQLHLPSPSSKFNGKLDSVLVGGRGLGEWIGADQSSFRESAGEQSPPPQSGGLLVIDGWQAGGVKKYF